MVPWWWLVLSFFAGGLFGVMIYAVCAYDNASRKDTRWYEDEQR